MNFETVCKKMIKTKKYILATKESNSPIKGKVAASKTLMNIFYSIKKINLASS